jgi:hypothetical protein
MKGIIYDCEIIKCIPSYDESEPDLEYCGGWEDFANMGISVIGAYELETNRYRIFLKDNLDEFQNLVEQSEHIIGFNSISFDDNLCRANGINITTTYDLLCEVRIASGQPPHYTPRRTRGGYSLDALAYANLNCRKSGSGAKAPILWQQGRIGEVIDYCLNDVQITVALWERAQTHGWLEDPTNGKALKLKQIPYQPQPEPAVQTNTKPVVQTDDLPF